MKTVTINVYTFDELNDEAKERARDWWRETYREEFWLDEFMNSLNAFCNQFGVTVTDYSLGAYAPNYINTDATPENFRGLKLREFDREAMPTGYCADCEFWETFYDTWESTSSAWLAFSAAMQAGLKFIKDDLEYHSSNAFIDEMLEINEFEFTEDGNRWTQLRSN